MKKILMVIAALTLSLNVFAYDYDEVVVCDYMATLVKHEENGDKAFFVNVLRVSDKDINTGFVAAQNVAMKKVKGLYELSYENLKLQIGSHFYIITETVNGEELVEVRECKINPLQY